MYICIYVYTYTYIYTGKIGCVEHLDLGEHAAPCRGIPGSWPQVVGRTSTSRRRLWDVRSGLRNVGECFGATRDDVWPWGVGTCVRGEPP